VWGSLKRGRGRLSDRDLRDIKTRVAAFGQKSGWEGDQKDAALLISFVLGVIEDSSQKFPDVVIKELNNAFDYLTRIESEDPDISEVESVIDAWATC